MDQSKQHAETFSLESLRAGDRAEFVRLVETYSGSIYRLVYRILENQQDAEDALQEAFIKAFRSLTGHSRSSFDGRSSLATWLYRIATNEALMILRRHKRPVFSIDTPDGNEDEEQEPLQIVDWCCVPEIELMSAEARSTLEAAIQRLPKSLGVVFLLREIEGLSTQETAEVLSMTETAVKTRLSRARLKLREMLSGYYAERIDLAGQGQDGEKRGRL